MGVIGRCRRRLIGIVAGVRHALAVRLQARPPAITHAAATGAEFLSTPVPATTCGVTARASFPPALQRDHTAVARERREGRSKGVGPRHHVGADP